MHFICVAMTKIFYFWQHHSKCSSGWNPPGFFSLRRIFVHSKMHIFVLVFCKWKLFRSISYILTLNTKKSVDMMAGHGYRLWAESVSHLLLCTDQFSVRGKGDNFGMWENWDMMTLLIILNDANWGLHLSSTPFKLIPTVRNACVFFSIRS